jgi:single-strand DNA-binding protein
MNKVILRGHLGADPRNNITTTNNVPVCNFRMATNHKWTDKVTNVLQEKVEWHNVVCWNKLALTVGQHMKKGSQVLVEGRLETRSYEVQHVDPTTKQAVFYANGQPLMITRYTTEVVARTVDFLDKKPGTSAYAPAAGQPVVAGAPAAGVPFVMSGQPVGTTVVGGDAAAVAAAFAQPGTVVPGADATVGVVNPVVLPGV